MKTIGTVESLWRYPVKSMRGEELDKIFAAYAGVYCDRLFAFHSSANRTGFPYLTARDQRRMLSFRPRFRQPEKAAAPPNLSAAENAGATPLYADPTDLMLDVETPDGRALAIDDPELIEMLRDGIDDKHQITLLRSERALTDCRPVSLFSVQTAQKLAEETGVPVDKRRFRANIYLDLTKTEGFAEDDLVGHSLRIGPKATLAVLERDSRCMVITLDPETGEKTPAVLKNVAQAHGGMAGIYAAVLVAGMIHQGDSVELFD
jgi:MOSC domain-containing protein